MRRPGPCRSLALLLVAVGGFGCSTSPPAGSGSGGPAPASSTAGKAAAGQGGASSGKKVMLVGFDANEPLVKALQAGKVQGLVLQDPFRMGEQGVKTMAAVLEKKKVEAVIDTGEAIATPETMTDPKIDALLHPPKEENVSGENLASGRKKRWKIIVIPKGTTHEFWKTVHAGAKKGADDLGTVDLVWMGPQKEDDRSYQVSLVKNAIAAGVDGIVLAPLDSRALVQPVEEAVGKGIPVVVIDSALESKAIASYVATNNYQGGVLAAKRLGQVLNGEGKVILLRYAVGSASTTEREQGFTDTIAREFPKITYLSDSEYAGPTTESAQQKAQTLATRFRGQVDGVFCPNETSSEGMLRALEGAGMLPVGP